MTCRLHPIGIGASLLLLLMSGPVRAQETATPLSEHAGHHDGAADRGTSQGTHRLSAAQLDELMTTVNTSEGAEKLSAMTILLQALVKDRQSCEEMMEKMKNAHEPADAAALRPHQVPK